MAAAANRNTDKNTRYMWTDEEMSSFAVISLSSVLFHLTFSFGLPFFSFSQWHSLIMSLCCAAFFTVVLITPS